MQESGHKEYKLEPIDVGKLLKDFKLETYMVIFCLLICFVICFVFLIFN